MYDILIAASLPVVQCIQGKKRSLSVLAFDSIIGVNPELI